MTNNAQNFIIGELLDLQHRFDERASRRDDHPENRAAYHGVARSIEKLVRRASVKITIEERDSRHHHRRPKDANVSPSEDVDTL